MDDQEPEFKSVDQIPDDPLKMPPPYWRSSGAVFHIIDALESVQELLDELIVVSETTSAKLDEHYATYPDDEEHDREKVLSEFADITNDQFEIEFKIRLKSEIVCLMSAIEAEDTLNQFCVFNLHRNISEPIEKLSPVDKMMVATAAIGHYEVKGTAHCDALQKLVKWRNAFAHGHCVDRPTTSLRHNHLISPDSYPGAKSALADLIEMARAFLRVTDFLRSVSVNTYLSGGSSELKQIEDSIDLLLRYKIEDDERLEIWFDDAE
jgi:hypothetical protein